MDNILVHSALPPFDVKAVRPDRRMSAWTDKLNELYYPLDVENPSSEFTFGYLCSTNVGGLRFGGRNQTQCSCTAEGAIGLEIKRLLSRSYAT